MGLLVNGVLLISLLLLLCNHLLLLLLNLSVVLLLQLLRWYLLKLWRRLRSGGDGSWTHSELTTGV